ncbi:MAG: multidrug effflux MFS transporter [Ilumatobacter sp.]
MTELDTPASTARQYRMQRRELLFLISAINALMALGIDLMLPAFDRIREAYDLGEGSPRTGQVITVYFLGMAFAQVAWGPLTDRFGRKPILYVSIGIYLVAASATAIAPSFLLLLASRFVWGIGASGARTVTSAIIRDRFEGVDMAKAMSQIMAVFMLVPILAPVLGTGIIAILPWRGVFWFCVVWAALIGMWSLRLRETLPVSEQRPLSFSSSVLGYREVMRTRVTAGYNIATVFLQGVFTTYLASSELLISEVFDRRAQFPFIFGCIAVLFAMGALVNGLIVGIFGVHGLVNKVYLVTMSLTVASVVVSVLADGRPNFWIYIPLLGLTLGSFMFLMPNLSTAALDPMGHLAGTASAFGGAVRIGGGAVLGTIVSSQVSDSTTPFAIGVLLLCGASWITVLVTRQRSPHLRVNPSMKIPA